MIVTFLPNPQHRVACDNHGRRVRDAVQHCETHSEFHSQASSPRVHTIVADLAGWSRANLNALVDRVRLRLPSPQILAVHGISNDESRSLRALIDVAVDLVTVYPAYHELELAFDAGAGRSLRSATVELIRRLPGNLPAELGHFLLGCIVLGERHTTMRRVSGEVAISDDRARQLVVVLGYDDFRGLIGDIRLLHALYRIGLLGASEKATAIAGGYADARELGRLCTARVGRSPVYFARQCDGFEQCARAFVARTQPGHSTLRR